MVAPRESVPSSLTYSTSESDSQSTTVSSSSQDEYSESCCDSSDESSSEHEEPNAATRVTNLSFNLVMSGERDSDDDDDDGCYAANGKDPARVKAALRTSCCKSKCKKHLSLRGLLVLVSSFWSLTKNAQDAVLWSMQHPVWTPNDDEESCESHSVSARKSSKRKKSRSRSARRFYEQENACKIAWHIEGCLI